jgi:hypothetical protein
MPVDGATAPLAAPAASLTMLVPPMLKFVPSRPMLASPALPSALCHWMPNSAALSAFTSAIRLSTNTWARRASSLSMTARSWRYCGADAVMMSALVAGSA